MHGAPALKADFKHYGYANPDAPKGGRVTFANVGSFDSLNPLVVKGVAAAGLRGKVYESLMSRNYDEPFSLYGLLAESVETPEDRSWVTFTLNENARFSDGKPVTVDDVIFSHALLRDKGRPNHRFYYAKAEKVEKVGERSIRFTFKPDGDREMPLIMGLMPVLPRHAITRESFEKTGFTPPIGSGPYRVGKVDPGSKITYVRNRDYWGRDLPVNRGQNNFDTVIYEYYRDANSQFEAFKKGLYDVRSEGDPTRWATGYKFPAARDGRVVLDRLPIHLPSGMSAFVFNTRRPVFSDPKVREALTYLFDFEWVNKNLHHGLHTRTKSYFDRSELSSHGKPASENERTLLAPYGGMVKPAIMDGTYKLPASNGSGRNRGNRRKAIALLKKAGYAIKDGRMTHTKTGKTLAFEILVTTRAQERLVLNFSRSLGLAGIQAKVRQVDSAQYQRRRTAYEYDMIQNFWYASLSPGNEQTFRWSQKSAVTEGTFNFAGVSEPAVDAMIEALLAARTREAFTDAVRALDRVLLSGHYVIPLFHLPHQWVARWNRIRRPERTSLYGYKPDTWWSADAPREKSP